MVWIGKILKGNYHLVGESIGLKGRIILKCIRIECVVKVWAGFRWLRVWCNRGFVFTLQ
jgi:hypothetical protein